MNEAGRPLWRGRQGGLIREPAGEDGDAGVGAVVVGAGGWGDEPDHHVGFAYDANGNMTAMPGVTGIAYDVRNRLTAAGGDQYSYRPDNKRLWKKLPGGAEEIYFYSIAGEELGTYEPTLVDTTLYLKFKSTNVYYAGTLIRSEGQAVVLDRLGSVRSFGGTSIRYFPYGEEQTSTPNDRQKFGTYYRDASTGLDYANQRYYGSGVGRFASADPLQGVGGLAGPVGWNQFAYVDGDPVNLYDPTGLIQLCPPGTRAGPDARSCVPNTPQFRPPVVHNGGPGGAQPEPPQLMALPPEPITPPIDPWAGLLDEQADFEMPMIAFALARANPLAVALLLAANYLRGLRGEMIVSRLIGMAKNTERLNFSVTGAAYRVPDFWERSANIIHEVKNVSRVEFTRQMVDYLNYVRVGGGHVVVYVRNETTISPGFDPWTRGGLIEFVRVPGL